MARTGASPLFGSDATIDDRTTKSFALIANPNPAAGAQEQLVGKATGVTAWGLTVQHAAALEADGHLHFTHDFATADGDWASANNTVSLNAYHALGVTYDRTNVANDPVGYVDGASVTVASVVANPIGAAGSDAASNLSCGAAAFTAFGWFVYDEGIMTAADMNRHRWYGTPYGPGSIDVWHPMWTESTVNKGTAVAPLTENGSTMTSIPKVERMFMGCTGCGR